MLDTENNNDALNKVGVNGIKSIEISMEAYLGSGTITIEALEKLNDGDIVELTSPLNGAVSLLINGVVVAYGELVAVGDQFGVKVSAVAK